MCSSDLTGHGRKDHDDLIAFPVGAKDFLYYLLLAFKVANRGSTEFLYDDVHLSSAAFSMN